MCGHAYTCSSIEAGSSSDEDADEDADVGSGKISDEGSDDSSDERSSSEEGSSVPDLETRSVRRRLKDENKIRTISQGPSQTIYRNYKTRRAHFNLTSFTLPTTIAVK